MCRLVQHLLDIFNPLCQKSPSSAHVIAAITAQVAKAVGSKDAAACEALYQRFQTYLSLPRALQHQTVFLALIRDMHNQASKVCGSILAAQISITST